MTATLLLKERDFLKKFGQFCNLCDYTSEVTQIRNVGLAFGYQHVAHTYLF